jgi:hypothetical protein
MPKKEKLPQRIDETVAEIAAILARGFMKYKSNGRLAADPAGIEREVSQCQESEVFAEKRLVFPPHQSVHALKS